MRLRSARVPQIAEAMVKALTTGEAIECERPKEVKLDIEAVLNEYIRTEENITEQAKDLLAQRNLPPKELGKIKRLVADQHKFKLGDAAIDYVLDQLLQMLMYSDNVDEIFAEDYELRRRMRAPLRQELAVEAELEAEVRTRLKHVEEGGSLWEVEYRRMMDDIKRRKGL
jgi:hypothetical protein